MIHYVPQRELSYVMLSGSWKKFKGLSSESDFMKQIFTGELSGEDSVGVLRQGVKMQIIH